MQVLVGAYGSDAVRYYFAKEVEFGRDGDFAEERFRAIVNADLANTFGNLLNRTLGLLKKNCGGAVPGDAASIAPDHPLRSFAAEQARAVTRKRARASARGRHHPDAMSASFCVLLQLIVLWSEPEPGVFTSYRRRSSDLTAVTLTVSVSYSALLWTCRSSWQRPRTRQCAFTQLPLRSWPSAPVATCTWRRSRHGQPSRCPPPS